MAKKEREIERWITVNGARVPIYSGQSVDEAMKEKQIAKNKKDADARNNKKTPWEMYKAYQDEIASREDLDNVTDAEWDKLEQLRLKAKKWREETEPKQEEKIDVASIESAKRRGNFKQQRKFRR